MRTSPGALRAFAIAACAMGCMPAEVHAQAAAEPEFIYRFQPRDTLIHVSRRLLLQPQRWPELQRRNGIANPRNIPPDTPLRVPYSWLRLAADTAVVQSVAGVVSGAGARITAGERLPQGVTIVTGDDGSITIAFADGSVVTLQRAGSLTLEHLQRVEGVDDAHSIRLNLDAGRIETKVKPRRDVGRFEIVTPVATSAVRGTQFRTGFNDASDAATTETLEGNVNVGGGGGAVSVLAGFGTRVTQGASPLPPVPLLPAPDLAAVPATNSTPDVRVALRAVPGAASYRVQLAGDAEFQTLTFDAVAADPITTIPALGDGNYWLRARAIDGLGIEGRDAVQTLTQRVLPAAPLAAAPAPDARIAGTDPTFVWSEIAGAARYRVQLASDAEFATLVHLAEVTAAQLTLEELPEGRYYWRVAAINDRGDAGAFSESRPYTQRPAPLRVTAVVQKDRSVALSWTVHPASRYRVQVARDPAFAKLVDDEITDQAELNIRPAAAGRYHARVQIVGADGIADPFGEAQPFEVPVPTWVKVLLPVVLVLPFL